MQNQPQPLIVSRAMSTLDKLSGIEFYNEQEQKMSTQDSNQIISELVQKNRELQHYGKTIAVVSYICFVITLICNIILGSVFYLSKTMDAERKSFFLLITGLCGGGFILMLIIARRHWTTLLIFTVLSTFISGFALGVSLSFA
jgi:hypothetical protein